MNSSDEMRFIGRLHWAMEGGPRDTFTRDQLERLSRSAGAELETVLKKWESAGEARILKPLVEAERDESCVQILGYISLPEH